MSPEKLEHDSKVLHRFIQFYCDKEHAQMPKKEQTLVVVFAQNPLCGLPYCLCDECDALLQYAYHRLEACPQDPKPSCRKCKTPCYERSMWKKMAKIMRYSGIRLGFIKLRKLFS